MARTQGPNAIVGRSPANTKTRARRKSPQLWAMPVDCKHYLEWYQLAPAEKIATIRNGIPARSIGELSRAMEVPQSMLMESLGLSHSTVNRKAQKNQRLSPTDSERVAGLTALIGRVQAMVTSPEEFPDFDAAKWTGQWINEPLPALGGRTAASYLDTLEGQQLIAHLLGRIEGGVYS